MRPTQELAQSALFQPALLYTLRSDNFSIPDKIKLSYERARAIGRAYGLTIEDILFLSPKFWDLYTDPIAFLDAAAATLLTIQYNLCAGTLVTYLAEQPSLAPIIQRVLNFDVSGQFCLTEIGRGLDVIHMETTATLLQDGFFDLHTPVPSAAKCMPPTSPVSPDLPCISIVFARTIVHGEDHGIKAFYLQLHDGESLTPGVTIKVLPPRGGSRPLNHSLTYFNHVRLPRTALLGRIKKPVDYRAAFFSKIYRVAIGTIALSSIGVPSLQLASYIAARYSQRRHVADAKGISKPIISFQTQKQPILTAVAQSFVLQEMHKQAVAWFMDPTLDPRVRHAVATVHKVAMIQAAQAANFTLGDRCGAQGLFEVNQITSMHSDMRGNAIAEGDMLGISIRLTSELLIGRYELEPTRYPDSLLAQHEKGLFLELRAALAIAPSHRSSSYDRKILPRSLAFIQAIGHRMSYDAARAAAIDPPLLDLFEIVSVLEDESWYVECLGITRSQLREREACAIDAVFPHLEEYLTRMDIAQYAFAPISSDEKWKLFMDRLQTFGATSSEFGDLGAGIVGALVYYGDSPTQAQMAPRRRVRSML